MWANCLRHLPDEGITVAELRRRARTGTNLDGMRRWRYVTYAPDPSQGKGQGKRPEPDAIVTPTAAGRRAREVWQAATEETEVRWRIRFGPDAVDGLRAALADLVARLDPALPDCLPVLGYGLRSTKRRDPPAASADVRDTAGSGGTTALPLWALLSKPLLAFALEYEQAPGPSLAVSANVLRVLTEGGVRTRDIPALAGISKESVAMAVGLLAEGGLATEGPDPDGSRFKVTRLTAAGTAARDAYSARAADIEADWRSRFGAVRVEAVRAALEPLTAGDPPPLFAALEPYPDNWRARVKPAAVLPHYPMTLHRGGFPDGA
jgi:DNA-binding MarR family transcriptional regulator